MNESLKSNLYTIAKHRGLTKIENGMEDINQSALQGKTGVPQTTLSGILKQGKAPGLGTLEKLALGLGVGVWQLLAPPAVLQASLTPKFPELVELLSRE